AKEPYRPDSKGRAGGIDQHVPWRSLPGRFKSLVQFIADGIERGDSNGKKGIRTEPWPVRIELWLASSPPEQGGQDGVFGEMAAFADAELNRSHRFIAGIRYEQAQEWP